MNQFKISMNGPMGPATTVVEAKDLAKEIIKYDNYVLEQVVYNYSVSVWTDQGKGRWLELLGDEALAWAETMIGEL